MAFVAVYDACVLYPWTLRDLLMRLARTDLFRARWTNEIHEEWIAAVVKDRPDIDRKQLERCRKLMDAAVPDCIVADYEGLAGGLDLPDLRDQHVVAAAIRCQAGVIVTTNLRDFPDRCLAPLGLEAQHPDDFVSNLFDLNPAAVCTAVKHQRTALTRPPVGIDEMISRYLKLGLINTVASLEPMKELL